MEDKWYFTAERLENSPSRKHDIDATRELSYRQQAANFIQDMGQRLQLSQLCINTAITYVHRFYVFHSFGDIHRNKIAYTALFLAAKVEEQPRKIEHVIKVAHACLHKDSPQLDVRSEEYIVKLNEAVALENILLQTLGFDIGIEHPHTYVVKVCQLVKAHKDLAQTSYIMATTSLHMTNMCLKYKPTIVACVCIHLACKWSNYRIEKCSEGRDWFYYVDKDITGDLIEKLTKDFIEILERSPHRFKKKLGKDGTLQIPRPMENNPSVPGPSGAGSSSSSTNSGASTSNNNKPTAVPVDNKIGILIKKEKDPSPGPSNADIKEDKRKLVVVKKEPECSIKKEKINSPVPPPQPLISSVKHHQVLQLPYEHAETVEIPEEKIQPPLPQHHSQPPPPPPAVHMPSEHSSSKRSSKESLESSGSKKHKSKHASRSKSSSSSSNNHSEPTSSGIKVKIRKDIISLSGVDCNQKYNPSVKAESPKKPLKIKLPKLPPPVESPKPEKTSTPASLKIVLTKDKSGSGSYSTSHSRKRSRTSESSHRSSDQKNHSGERPSKISRHSSSHRSDVDNTHNNISRLQYPAVGEYMVPPPPLPKLKTHHMMVGKTNSNVPMLPPLPPPQPPPPPPPPEDI